MSMEYSSRGQKNKKINTNITTTVQSLFAILGASLGPPSTSRVT